MTRNSPRLRIFLLQVLVVCAFGILAAQLWRLQIVHAPGYQAQADYNRFRLVPVDAPRGVIYDRQGRPLARNIPVYTISIVPASLPTDKDARQAVLTRLSQLLDMPVSSQVASAGEADMQPGIEEILEQNTINPMRRRLSHVIHKAIPKRRYMS